LDAPEFLIVDATGITPQEQSGIGIPIRVDLSIEDKLFEPICFKINLLSIKI
jgi:hypothetical protein